MRDFGKDRLNLDAPKAGKGVKFSVNLDRNLGTLISNIGFKFELKQPAHKQIFHFKGKICAIKYIVRR